MPSCSRHLCGQVSGLWRVDGSGFLFKEFTAVLSTVLQYCGRFLCGPVGGLREVDGSSLLFKKFTTVISTVVNSFNNKPEPFTLHNPPTGPHKNLPQDDTTSRV